MYTWGVLRFFLVVMESTSFFFCFELSSTEEEEEREKRTRERSQTGREKYLDVCRSC